MMKKKSPSIKEILKSLGTADSDNKTNSESVHKDSKENYFFMKLGFVVFIMIFSYIAGVKNTTAPPVYMDERVTINYPYLAFKELVSNLKIEDDQKQRRYMRLTMNFKLSSESDIPFIKQKISEMIDSYYVISRDITVGDLKGTEKLKIFKNKLLVEFNEIIHPAVIQEVLIQELLIQ